MFLRAGGHSTTACMGALDKKGSVLGAEVPDMDCGSMHHWNAARRIRATRASTCGAPEPATPPQPLDDGPQTRQTSCEARARSNITREYPHPLLILEGNTLVPSNITREYTHEWP